MTVEYTSLLAYRDKFHIGSLASERRKIISLMSTYPKPLTSAEIAMILEIDRHNIASRLCDLSKDEIVEKLDKRQCEVCGRLCCTWGLTE